MLKFSISTTVLWLCKVICWDIQEIHTKGGMGKGHAMCKRFKKENSVFMCVWRGRKYDEASEKNY